MKLVERFTRFARQNTKQEWEQLFGRRRQELRSWIEEHPERASIYGFVAGIVITLFFKAVIAILVIAALICYGIYFLAKDQKDSEG